MSCGLSARGVTAFLLAVCLGLVGGCLSLPREPVVVNDSQLNWLAVEYKPLEDTAPPSSIDIFGVGYIDFMQGYSPRLSDSFTQDVDNPNWNRMIQERIGMTPDNARKIIQQFVNAGLLEQPSQPRKAPDEIKGIARFRWNINNEKGGCLTADPLLLEMLDRLAGQLSGQAR